MSWSEIVGQKRVKRLLQRMFEADRLPHALLFHGPEGVGKDAAALQLARVLNCEKGGWNPCDACATCKQMNALRHPRLKLVFPLPSREGEESAFDKLTADEMEEVNNQIERKAENPYFRIQIPKASGIKISSIRDIRKEAGFRASERGRTVVVIMEADRMNANASNALLKNLEEPGGDILFILTTSRRDALLPTIISRCQQVRFETLSDGDLRVALETDHELAADRIDLAVQLAAGNYTAALGVAYETDSIRHEDALEFLRAVVKYDPPGLMEHIQRLTGKDDRRSLGLFLTLLGTWFRDVAVIREGLPDRIRNANLADPLKKFTAHYPHTDVAAAVEAVEKAIDLLSRNVHLSLLMVVLAQRLRRCITGSV